jgi:pSer/pThr/pTyr-binding forkhead associated (FHA) protein
VKTLVIGRSPFADVVVADPSVAPHHAELVVTDDGRLYLVDCASAGGTWRQQGGSRTGGGRGAAVEPERWQPIRQGFVAADEQLRLGDHRCTGEALLRAARDGVQSPAPPAAMAATGASPGDGGRQPLRGRVERDALTGEIVRRRP